MTRKFDNVLIVLVFVPTEAHLKCVLDIVSGCAGYPTIYVGWCAKAAYWSQIEREIFTASAANPPLFVMKQAENVGKAMLMNLAVSKLLNQKIECTYLTFCDSDLKISKASAAQLVDIMREIPPHKQGLVACNQNVEATNHAMMDDDPVMILPSGQRLCVPKIVSAVAGGCFIIPLARWREVGPLPAVAVYYNEDTILNMRLEALDAGLIVGIAQELTLEHHSVQHAEFMRWKLAKCVEDNFFTRVGDDVLMGADQCVIHLKIPASADAAAHYKNAAHANPPTYAERHQASMRDVKTFWENAQ
uniref:Glycosyltransferase n=1 Tax=viral metagenome TaxID=1070528 RepID=A0A6C0BN40_9ZZZZ